MENHTIILHHLEAINKIKLNQIIPSGPNLGVLIFFHIR